MACSRSPGKRLTLGLLTHGAGDPNSHSVWAGVASVAQEHDANLICFPGKPLRSPLEFEAQSNVLYELVGAQNVDGLVIWSAGLPLFVGRQEINAFCERFRPLPMVTAGVPIEGIPGVSVDNYRGMRAIVSHLIEVHRRTRIAFIRGPESHQEAEERYRAYQDVLAEHGIPCDPRPGRTEQLQGERGRGRGRTASCRAPRALRCAGGRQ